MSKPKTGRIYKIICSQSDVCYIGSTFNTLRDRFRVHKDAYNNWLKYGKKEVSICPYFKEFGIDQFKMVLVKEYSVCDRAHLEGFEQLWINKFRKTAANKVNPINIKKLSDKAYRAANKDQISEYHKQYRAANKDQLNERQKQYYEANKAAINQQQSQKIQCNCGGKYIVANKAPHIRTAKHQKWLQSS